MQYLPSPPFWAWVVNAPAALCGFVSKRTEFVYVEHFPCEPNGLPLGDVPVLGESGVDSEEAITPEVVSLPRLARIREPKRGADSDSIVDCIRVFKDLRTSRGIDMLMSLDIARLQPCWIQSGNPWSIRSEQC